jgi:hypothetical protein
VSDPGDGVFPLFLNSSNASPAGSSDALSLEWKLPDDNSGSANEVKDGYARALDVKQVNLVQLRTPVRSFAIIAVGVFPGANWIDVKLALKANGSEEKGIYDFDLIGRPPPHSDSHPTLQLAVSVWNNAPEDLKLVRAGGVIGGS